LQAQDRVSVKSEISSSSKEEVEEEVEGTGEIEISSRSKEGGEDLSSIVVVIQDGKNS
jgi:hypothetical protein